MTNNADISKAWNAVLDAVNSRRQIVGDVVRDGAIKAEVKLADVYLFLWGKGYHYSTVADEWAWAGKPLVTKSKALHGKQ